MQHAMAVAADERDVFYTRLGAFRNFSKWNLVVPFDEIFPKCSILLGKVEATPRSTIFRVAFLLSASHA